MSEGKGQFLEFMRSVRDSVGKNDTSASHATRVAGTENFKTKYAPEFPTVTIVEAHPGRIMTPEQLTELGFAQTIARRASEIHAPQRKHIRRETALARLR
jgi:hypothetical protein